MDMAAPSQNRYALLASGDCAAVDWTLLGGSIANWSFMWFAFCTVLLLALALRRKAG